MSSLPPRQVYEGDKPDGEIAVVDTKAELSGMGTTPIAMISAVDDKSFGSVNYHIGSNNFPSGVRLLPGKHVLTIVASPTEFNGDIGNCGTNVKTYQVWFIAEAGHHYLAWYRYEFDFSTCKSGVVMVDTTTNKPVGGLEGSSDEPAN